MRPGLFLPGATVTVTNIETGVERQVTTDAVGDFHFFVLPPGSYELKVTARGLRRLYPPADPVDDRTEPESRSA